MNDVKQSWISKGKVPFYEVDLTISRNIPAQADSESEPMSRPGAGESLISCCLGTTFEAFPDLELEVDITRKDLYYHKKGIYYQAFSGRKKTLHLVMRFSISRGRLLQHRPKGGECC